MVASMVQRVPSPTSNDNKERIMYFITLAPGVGSGNQRTYDMRNNKIVIKYSTREIFSFAFTLKTLSQGGSALIPNYRKFATSKSISIWESFKQESVPDGNGQTKQVGVRYVNITASNGNTKVTVGMTSEQAYGMGQILERMGEEGFRREIELGASRLSFNQSSGTVNQPQFANGNSNGPTYGQQPHYNRQ
jgi:hypothetical protein